MSNTLIIDTRVAGYDGSPTRLVATYDVPTGQLYISGEKPFKPVPKKRTVFEMLKFKQVQARTLIVTDSADSIARWDLLFNEVDNLTEVVRSYRERTKNQLLTIDESVQGRWNPMNVLQKRKLDINNGAIWELSAETENGHICILLACWAAQRASNNFSFTTQINEDLSEAHLNPDGTDLDEPFSV